MTPTPTSPIAEDLARWLETATKGLPAAAQQVVRAEIEAHYADAVSDHRAAGKTAEEAHRAAMADLGDVRATARALRDTHLARQRYARAAMLSLAVLAAFTLARTLNDIIGSWVLTSVIVRGCFVLSALYALYSFKVLLQLDSRFIERPISVVAWSLVVFNGTCVLFWVLFNQPTVNEIGTRSPWVAAPFFQKALDLTSLGGELATGVGSLLLGLGFAKAKNPLHGLRIPLCFLLLVLGCAEVGYIAGLIFEVRLAIILGAVSSSLVAYLTFALIALLFFRAAYPRSLPPLRTV